MGVWIETPDGRLIEALYTVTPCVGVWIETSGSIDEEFNAESHPAWVCGLKLRERSGG